MLMAIGAAVEMLHALLDVYAEEELYSDYGTSPRMSLVTPPPGDIDVVVGVVPGSERRKGYFLALQEDGTRLAEVYRLLREQTEHAGEIRLPSDTAAQGEGVHTGRRDSLEVWGGGSNLDVGGWDYEQM